MSMERRNSPVPDSYHDVSGIRQHAVSLLAVMLLFAALIGASTYCILKTITIGDYAARQIDGRFYVIVLIWLAVSLGLALLSVKISSLLSLRIAGPIRRMERLLDRMIAREDVAIVLREKDALLAVAEKINRIMERQKQDNDEH